MALLSAENGGSSRQLQGGGMPLFTYRASTAGGVSGSPVWFTHHPPGGGEPLDVVIAIHVLGGCPLVGNAGTPLTDVSTALFDAYHSWSV